MLSQKSEGGEEIINVMGVRGLIQREQGCEALRNGEKDVRMKPGGERESEQRCSEMLEVSPVPLETEGSSKCPEKPMKRHLKRKEAFNIEDTLAASADRKMSVETRG